MVRGRLASAPLLKNGEGNKMARPTLDDFFRVTIEFVLPNKRIINVRTLSDYEVQARSKAASIAARNRALELGDSNSVGYKETIERYHTNTREDNLDSLRILKQSEFLVLRRESSRPEIVVLPDDATIQERAEVEERRIEAEKAWLQEVEQGALLDVEAYLKMLLEKDDQYITSEVVAAIIDAQSRTAYYKEYEDQTVLYSCEANGKRLFKSIDDVRKLGSAVKQNILEAYNTVSGVDPWHIEDFFETGT
jgi:hypothetical protein